MHLARLLGSWRHSTGSLRDMGGTLARSQETWTGRDVDMWMCLTVKVPADVGHWPVWESLITGPYGKARAAGILTRGRAR